MVDLQDCFESGRLGLSLYDMSRFSVGKQMAALIDNLQSASRHGSRESSRQAVVTPDLHKLRQELHVTALMSFPVSFREFSPGGVAGSFRRRTVHYTRNVYAILRFRKRTAILLSQSANEARQLASYLSQVGGPGLELNQSPVSDAAMRECMRKLTSVTRLKVQLNSGDGLGTIRFSGQNLLGSDLVKTTLADAHLVDIGGLWSPTEQGGITVFLNRSGRAWAYARPQPGLEDSLREFIDAIAP